MMTADESSDTVEFSSKSDADVTPKTVADGEDESDRNDLDNKAGENDDPPKSFSNKDNSSPEKSVVSPDSPNSKSSTPSAARSDTDSITEDVFTEHPVPQSIDEKKSISLDVSSPPSDDDNFPVSPPLISPASTHNSYVTHNTYNTYKTFSTTNSDLPDNTQKIEIVSRSKKSKSASAGATALLCGMRKPILFLCIILLIGFVCTNFFGWFRVPGLDDQIKRLHLEIIDLEGEVDRLTASVEELSALNEDYAQLNKELQDEVEDLEQIDAELQDEVKEISSINQNLTANNLEISQTIVQLNHSTEELKLVKSNLTAVNHELKETNKALEENVNQLENSTDELTLTEEKLRKDIETLEDVSSNLTIKVYTLGNVTQDLNESITLYEELNTNLTRQEEMLNMSVITLTVEVNRMNSTVEMLEDLEGDLTALVINLNETNADLNATIIQVQNSTNQVNQEIDQLKNLNSDIIAYIDFYGNSTEYDTLEGIIGWLGPKNEAAEAEVMKEAGSLRNEYSNLFKDRLDDWYCAFEYEFAEYEWAKDTGRPIDNTQLDLVIEYVEKRVLDPLCLDTKNFEDYLTSRNLIDITTNMMIDEVEKYGEFAHMYYYPTVDDPLSTSVSTKDWMNANFSCANLASQYYWENQSA